MANCPVVDGRHGRFRYLPHDRYIGRSLAKYGEFSELETALLCRLCKPGSTVVEVGAFIGTHSVALSRHIGSAGRLYVFEPQPLPFALLNANLEANGASNAKAFQLAAGDETAPLRLPEIDYLAANNFGGIKLAAGDFGQVVQQVRLDDFLDLEALHLVKIDAEGMERAVLRGADTLLRRHRPLLSVENDRQLSSAALIECLFGLDYRLMWSLPPLFNPDNFLGDPENIFGGLRSINMVGIPAERYPGSMTDEITDPNQQPGRAIGG